jgi:hypothetical protein
MTHHRGAAGEEEHDAHCIGDRARVDTRYWTWVNVSAVSPGAPTEPFQQYCCPTQRRLGEEIAALPLAEAKRRMDPATDLDR